MPDCSKFVSLETQEPEEQEPVQVTNNGNGTAQVTAEFTIDRNCAECSKLLKQGTIQLDFEVQLELCEGEGVDEATAHARAQVRGGRGEHRGHELDVDVDPLLAEDFEPKPKQVKDRKTGKLKWKYPNSRYVRTLIGVELDGHIHCETCGVDVGKFAEKELIAAGEFDEQV